MPETVTTRRRTDTIRKAAILIATLDRETAQELLAKMGEQQASLVREAVLELDEISRDEQEEVIEQFLQSSHLASRHDDGVELDDSLARKLQSPNGYDDVPREPPRTVAPFHFLQDARTDPLVRQLERQHPQLIAVVVAHLPANRAAEVVKRLSPRTQAEVLRRVAELDQTDPEIVRDVEEELKQLLSGELRANRNRSLGLPVVAAILNAAGTERDGIVSNLASHEHELADLLEATDDTSGRSDRLRAEPSAAPTRISSQPSARRNTASQSSSHPPDRNGKGVVSNSRQTEAAAPANHSGKEKSLTAGETIPFAAIEQLDDDSWAALIRAAEPRVILLALAGASEKLVDRILSRLSIREAAAFRYRLEQAGPLRLADIDHAQHCVCELAGRLAAQGTIQLPSGRIVATA